MLGGRTILKEPAEAVVINLTFSKAYLDYYDNKIYFRIQNNARKGTVSYTHLTLPTILLV